MDVFVALAIIAFFLGLFVWSLAMQRKSFVRHKAAMELVQKELELANAQLENQKRMIALLEQIRDQGAGRSGSTAAST